MGDGTGTYLLHWRVKGTCEGLLLRPAQQGLGVGRGWARGPGTGGGHSKVAKQSQTPLRVRVPGK